MSAAKALGPAALVQDLCAKLAQQRDALNVQIAALSKADLQEAGAPSAELLLTLYLVLPGVTAVANMVNAQGLRVPGANGGLRAVLPTDIYALIRGDTCVIEAPRDAGIHAMALGKFQKRGGWTPGK